MQDDEQGAGHGSALVATTLLTAVVGVGAVLYNRANINMDSLLGVLGVGSGSTGGDHEKEIALAVTVDDKVKAPRSKERRRRAKDPLKEVLKGSRKAKARLEKVLASTNATVKPVENERQSEPESQSEYATTSRSVSAASSTRNMASSISSLADLDASSSHCAHFDDEHDDDDDELTPPAADSLSTTSMPSLADSASTTSASSVCTVPSDSEADPFTGGRVADAANGLVSHETILSQDTPLPYKQKYQQSSAGGPSRRRTRPTLTPSLTHLQAPQPRHSPSPSTSRPASVRPPSCSHSPHPSRPSTPPPQTQLASLRGALEASRTREEASKRDLERYGKELEMMRWERDALRAQVCQMQAYLGALLASPPPFTPYAMSPNPGSPSPMGVAGWYPPLHMQVPYGSGSPGSSPASRGRRRTRPDMGMAAEEEDDSEVSEVLADAILKRPNAMLGPRSTPQSPMGHSRPDHTAPRSVGHSPVRDSDELLEELTFPSLYPRQSS